MKAHLAFTLLVALFVGACAGGTIVNYNYLSDSYRLSFLNSVAVGGGMPTEIVGNPFPQRQARMQTVVTETLETSHFGPKFPFFTEVPEGFSSPYYTIILFNPFAGVNPKRLCQGAERRQAEPDPSAGIVVIGVFCTSDQRISSVYATLPAGAASPDEASFKKLISQVGHQLYPSRSPIKNGEDIES